MQVQVSTNNSVGGSGQLTSEIGSSVSSTLSRFADQITRVEVHLLDENAREQASNSPVCSTASWANSIGATGTSQWEDPELPNTQPR